MTETWSDGLFGALTADEVAPVPSSGADLLAAAQQYQRAIADVAAAVHSAHGQWQGLPDVLQADHITPALKPLMDPADKLASALQDSAESFVSVASAASTSLAQLQTEHDTLVSRIEQFRASAPGKMASKAAAEVRTGDLLGAAATVISSWKQVPELVGDEFALRTEVAAHNLKVSTTVSSIARQIDQITAGEKGTYKLPELGSASLADTLVDHGVPLSAAAAFTGQSVAVLLAGLDAKQVEKAFEDPTMKAWVAGLSAADAAAWWSSLDPAQKKGIIAAIPGVIGNLNGIPYTDRDAANRAAMDDEIAKLKAAGKTDTDEYQALENTKKALKKTPDSQLISLTLGAEPLAAVSVGNLDTASNVTWMVPGMGTSVKNNIKGYIGGAKNLRNQQIADVPTVDTAVVAWLGYKAPGGGDLVGEATDGLAVAGGNQLATAMQDFDATRSASGTVAPRVSVVAHSYGTLVAAQALKSTHADSVLLEGSAGIPAWIAPTAASLDVPKGQVFASQAVHDGWAITGQSTYLNPVDPRIDPTSNQFGAHDLSAEASPGLNAVTQHGPLVHKPGNTSYSYFDANTTAIDNAARVTTGTGASLPVGDTPAERFVANPDAVEYGAAAGEAMHGIP